MKMESPKKEMKKLELGLVGISEVKGTQYNGTTTEVRKSMVQVRYPTVYPKRLK